MVSSRKLRLVWGYSVLTLTLIYLSGYAGQTQQPPTSRPGENAAIFYRQACEHLPDYQANDEVIQSLGGAPGGIDWDTVFNSPWNSVPMDDKVRKLLADAKPSLVLLHQATTIRPCDWPARISATATTSSSRDLVDQLVWLGILDALHARDLNLSDHSSGASAWIDLIVLTRDGDSLPNENYNLMDQTALAKLEESAIMQIARELPLLPVTEIAGLKNRLDHLPDPMPFTEMVRAEQKKYNSEMSKARKEEPAQFTPLEEKKIAIETAVFDALVHSAGLTPQQCQANVDAALKPLDQVAGADQNEVLTICMTAIQLQWEMASLRAKREMLRAAVLYEQAGPDGIKQVKDPYGTGPFEFCKVGNGFELSTKMTIKEHPVKLAVGDEAPH